MRIIAESVCVCVCVFVREGKASSVSSLCACGVLETVTTAVVARIPNLACDRNVEVGVNKKVH